MGVYAPELVYSDPVPESLADVDVEAIFGTPSEFTPNWRAPELGLHGTDVRLTPLSPGGPEGYLRLDPKHAPDAQAMLDYLADDAPDILLPQAPERPLETVRAIGRAVFSPIRRVTDKIPVKETDIRHPDAVANIIGYAFADKHREGGVQIVPNADPDLAAVTVPTLRREISARADLLTRTIGVRRDTFERAPSRTSELVALIGATYDIPPEIIQDLGDDVVESAFSDEELRAVFTADPPKAPLWRRLLGKDKPAYQPRLHRLTVINYDLLPEHLVSLSNAARQKAIEHYDDPTIRAASWAIDRAVEQQLSFSPEPATEATQPWWKFAPVLTAARRGRGRSPATDEQLPMRAPAPPQKSPRPATRMVPQDPMVVRASYLHALANESPF